MLGFLPRVQGRRNWPLCVGWDPLCGHWCGSCSGQAPKGSGHPPKCRGSCAKMACRKHTVGLPRPWVMGKGPCVQCRVPRESRRAGIFHSCVQGPLQFPGRVLAPQSMRAGTKWIHGSAEELSQRYKKHRLSLSLAGCLFPTNMRTLHKNRVSRVSEAGWCVLSLLAW